ncbi:MAG TPA: hypothetical protein VK902_07385 [Rubrobacter sp.]|nr:hypothetical protein [Rubrobacter sp.]
MKPVGAQHRTPVVAALVRALSTFSNDGVGEAILPTIWSRRGLR